MSQCIFNILANHKFFHIFSQKDNKNFIALFKWEEQIHLLVNCTEAGTKLKKFKEQRKGIHKFLVYGDLAHLAILAFAINKKLEVFTSCW
ncbi:hypothetical protein T479_02460 [Lysinibacillus varians]|nr:hypothetical protein T479_02460 [Lysinibacillus varians]